MPRVGIDIYEIVLKEFAKSAGASQSKGILLGRVDVESVRSKTFTLKHFEAF